MQEKYRTMTEQEALSVLRKAGVKVDGRKISGGSYSLSIWSAIDCLQNHIGGYGLVN